MTPQGLEPFESFDLMKNKTSNLVKNYAKTLDHVKNVSFDLVKFVLVTRCRKKHRKRFYLSSLQPKETSQTFLPEQFQIERNIANVLPEQFQIERNIANVLPEQFVVDGGICLLSQLSETGHFFAGITESRKMQNQETTSLIDVPL